MTNRSDIFELLKTVVLDLTLAKNENQAKAELLANMRHDLGPPLAGIAGFAELLKTQTQDAKSVEYIDNLVAATHSLKDFLNQVLEAIKLSSEKLKNSAVEPQVEISGRPYVAPLGYNHSEPYIEEKMPVNILVVEDNIIAQKAILAILNTLACNVNCANNGEEAIALCKKYKFDLIFMDIGLGHGMDGYEVTSFIRGQENAEDIPILALTAHGGEENKQRCLESGMNGVFVKPLTKVQAASILETYIS